MSVVLDQCQIEVLHGDICGVASGVEAVVSSDDNYLSAAGGVSGAILRAAADDSIRAEMERHVCGSGPRGGRSRSQLAAGDAVATGAGRLGAKHIFHAVVIDFDRDLLPDANIV